MESLWHKHLWHKEEGLILSLSKDAPPPVQSACMNTEPNW